MEKIPFTIHLYELHDEYLKISEHDRMVQAYFRAIDGSVHSGCFLPAYEVALAIFSADIPRYSRHAA